MSQTKRLGHEIDESGIKPNEEKVESILKLKPQEKKRTKIVSRGDTIHGKILTENFGTDGPTKMIVKEKRTIDIGRTTAKRFQKNRTDVNRSSVSSTLCERLGKQSNNRR